MNDAEYSSFENLGDADRFSSQPLESPQYFSPQSSLLSQTQISTKQPKDVYRVVYNTNENGYRLKNLTAFNGPLLWGRPYGTPVPETALAHKLRLPPEQISNPAIHLYYYLDTKDINRKFSDKTSPLA